MNKEEKQAIEKFKNIIATYQDVIDEQDWYSYEEIESAKEYQEVAEKILEILYKQQKEIEELKTITNQYQAYKVNGYGKGTIVFASKEYFDNGSFKEAPSIDELEDLQNQIAELKDKLEIANKVIDKMADSMYNRPAYINLPYMKTKEEIKEYFYKEIENG